MPQTPVHPVFVLLGSDAQRRLDARREIISRVFGPDPDDQLSVTLLDGGAIEMSDLLDELRTGSLLSAQRVVIVRDTDALLAKKTEDPDEAPRPGVRKKRATPRDILERYFDAPAESATLVLEITSGKNWTKTSRLAKKLPSVGELIDCTPLSGANRTQWIIQSAQQRGKTISPAAAELLSSSAGEDLASQSSELDKLTCYVGDRETIEVQDVATMVPPSSAVENFALTNAITQGNSRRAMEILESELSLRGAEFRLLGQIRWHVQRALTAAGEIASGKTPNIRLPYQARKEFMTMLRRRPLAKLQQDVRRLLSADLAMKSSQGKPKSVLRQLIIGLCT